MTPTEIAQLRQNCHTILPGHPTVSPAQQFAAMSQWCETHNVQHDVYGEGETVQGFEHKIAQLLGMETGLFCITGTMTQVTALRLACSRRNSNLVGLHPTSHIFVHENSNHELLNHFKALRIGNPYRPWTLDDIKDLPDPLAAVQYELPMREIGGQLPSWEQLNEIKAYCQEKNIHLHMDGARLWEAQAGFDRPLHEICAGFHSVYVSFYKGIGGLAGAMLLGPGDFTRQARAWMNRQGGNVARRTPFVVSAAMQFDQRLAQLPALFARTQWLFTELARFPAFTTNPAQPQSNMLHLHLPVSRERATDLRNQIAQEHGIWLFGQAVDSTLPGHCSFEWTIGSNLLDMDDAALRRALELLHAAVI